MALDLTGRRALVGGASSGLGRAVAHALAADGCDLLLWSRDPMRLRSAADEVSRQYHVEVATVTADARRPDAAALVADRVERSYGGVDVLVLNAGGPPFVDPLQTTPAAWRDAFQLVSLTPIDLTTRVLPAMRTQRYGRVIAILATSVREPTAMHAYSSAGRAALAAWLKTVAREVAVDGVTVNSVLPGLIDTPRVAALADATAQQAGLDADTVREQSAHMIPAGRLGRPAELAAVVSFLASERASYVTGAMIPCDGGMLRGCA